MHVCDCGPDEFSGLLPTTLVPIPLRQSAMEIIVSRNKEDDFHESDLHPVVYVNDHMGHAAVMEMFDKAIARENTDG